MKITVHPTSKIVEIADGKSLMPARIWEGVTEDGIPVHLFVTRISPTIPKDDPRQAVFQAELKEVEAPTAEVNVYPLRLIL